MFGCQFPASLRTSSQLDTLLTPFIAGDTIVSISDRLKLRLHCLIDASARWRTPRPEVEQGGEKEHRPLQPNGSQTACQPCFKNMCSRYLDLNQEMSNRDPVSVLLQLSVNHSPHSFTVGQMERTGTIQSRHSSMSEFALPEYLSLAHTEPGSSLSPIAIAAAVQKAEPHTAAEPAPGSAARKTLVAVSKLHSTPDVCCLCSW